MAERRARPYLGRFDYGRLGDLCSSLTGMVLEVKEYFKVIKNNWPILLVSQGNRI